MQHRRLRILSLSVAVIVLAAGTLWLERAPIAEMVVRRYLDAQGVSADYRIERLGTRRAVLSAVRIGDRERPDLTANHVVIDVAWSGGVPTPVRAVVEGASLRAGLGPTGLTFGALDRLLPKSTKPFTFPELDLTVEDGALSLRSPVGTFSGHFEGRGLLSNGFRGRLSLAPADLRRGGCGVRGVHGTVDIKVDQRVLAAHSALAASSADCGARAGRMHADFDARLPEPLDRGDAKLRLQIAQLDSSAGAARDLTVDLSATGQADALRGKWSVEVEDLASAAAAGRIQAAGNYHANPRSGELNVAGDARARLVGRSPALRQLASPLSPAGTPFRPLEQHLRAALARAAQGGTIAAAVQVDWRNGSGEARLRKLQMQADSGLRLGMGDDLVVGLPGGRIRPHAALTFGGGGLPSGRLNFVRTTSGAMDVELAMAPWHVPAARAAVPGLRLSYAGGRGTLRGLVELSGPVGGGRIDGLRLPLDLAIDLRRQARLEAAGCSRPSFDRILLSGYQVGRTSLTLCPRAGAPLVAIGPGGRLSGGLSLRSPGLGIATSSGGRYQAAARAVDAEISGSTAAPKLSLRVDDLAADIGGARLSLAQLSGTLASSRDGLRGSGRLSGAKAAGDLPAILERGSAGWSLASGALRLTDGSILVRDAQAAPRYQPIQLAGLAGVVRQGVVTLNADAMVAAKNVRLGHVRLRHDLSDSAGQADLTIDRFSFGESIQPYELSEIARGVVENAVGPVSGGGEVRWNANGITSGGALTLGGVSFATAALGPVDDVRGTIRFDDLFALTTPPGQSVTIGRINPGVAVENGVFRFQLLASHDVRIEGAEWPFAGGRLTLDPTMFELAATTRRYTLRVAGIEAAQFLQQFDFKNLNVTGRFSGALPLVFEEGRGRIDGGRLVAERGGGVIQYVGEVGRENMGAAARLAFDALRKMRYDSLAIELDGALDGEIVTGVRFSGVNEAPVDPAGGRIPVSATGLPFKFNLTVRAPFRALLNSAASLGDVRPIIRSGLPVDPAAVPGVPETK